MLTDNKLELHSLLYDININDSVKKEIARKLKIAKEVCNVISYLENKKIIIMDNLFLSLEQFQKRHGAGIEKNLSNTNGEVFYLFHFSGIPILLKELKDGRSLNFISIINDSLNLAVKSNFKNINTLNNYNKKTFIFDDEEDLLDYILFAVTTTNVDKKELKLQAQFSAYPLSSSFDIVSVFGVTHTKNIKNKAGQITDVLEKNNCRIALTVLNTRYSWIQLSIHTVKSKEYNWIDAGRTFFKVEKERFKYPENTIGTLTTPEQDTLINSYILKLSDTKNTKIIPITKDIINELEIEEKRLKKYAKKQELISKSLRSKLGYKLSNLELHDTSFKLNEVEYTKEAFTYVDQLIKVNSTEVNFKKSPTLEDMGFYVINSMVNTTKSWNNETRTSFDFIQNHEISSILDISFDIAYDVFIEKVLDKLTYTYNFNTLITSLNLTIGDVEVSFTRKINKNKNNVKSIVNYINDKRITRDDLPFCIYQAITFDNQKDYNKFLSEVSYTSLKIHKIVKKGLYYNIYDQVFQYHVNMVIPVTRVKNKNFLIINSVPHRIRNTNKVIRSTEKKSLFDVVELLLNSEIVENLAFKDLKGFVNSSKKEYEDRYLKIQKFIESTFKILDVKKVIQKTFHTGLSLNNLLEIQGKSRKYFISNTDPYNIYSEEGKYICMLDKTPFVAPEVKLVNRLYALKNDSVISNQIATLNF